MHGDAAVNRVRGSNLPLMNLHERVLSVMGCRYVDDVLIDAPYRVTPDMVASLNIAEVVHGSISDGVSDWSPEGRDEDGGEDGDDDILNGDGGGDDDDEEAEAKERRYGDRYQYPREEGIFHIIRSPTDFNLGSITDRIRQNQETFRAKIRRKKKAERVKMRMIKNED